MKIDRVVITTFPGYFFITKLCIRSIKKYFPHLPIDIIIDDSMHITEHQLNIIEVASQYLKPGGILIIEDLNVNDAEDIFDSVISNHFAFNTFIQCEHQNKRAENNDKLWVGIKR